MDDKNDIFTGQHEDNEMLPGRIDQLYKTYSADLERTERELLRLSAILSQAAVSILITDTNGKIEYANPHFEKVSGYSAADLLGKNPSILKSGVQNPETYREMWATIIRGEVWKGRFTNKNKNGALYTEDVTIFPVRTDSGTVINFAAVKTDVTAQVEAERALRQSKESIQRAFTASRRELEQIAQLHAEMVPHRYEPAGGLNFVGQCKPCANLGGDFYHVYTLPDGRVSVLIADVSGHGAKAAVSTATSRALICAALSLLGPGDGPANALYTASRWLQDQLSDDQFVTVWLGIWDPARSLLTYCSAAHPPAIMLSPGGEPRFLPQDQTVPAGISCLDIVPAAESSVELAVGDRIFLYTDGWTEATSVDGKMLDGEGLVGFVANTDRQPLKNVPVVLFYEFERYAANSVLTDDLTVLVFERVS